MTQQLPATLDDIAQAQAAGTHAALTGADPRTNPWPIDSTNERLAFLNWCWRQGYSAAIVETMDAAGAYDHLDDDQTSNQHD